LVHDGGEDEELGEHGHVGLEQVVGKDDLRVAVQDRHARDRVNSVFKGWWGVGREWGRVRCTMRSRTEGRGGGRLGEGRQAGRRGEGREDNGATYIP